MLTDFDRTKASVYTVNTKNSPLMLRVMPDTKSTVLAEMKKGEKCVCYGIHSNKWYMVDYIRLDGVVISGFAHSDYLKKGECI